jgi:hypothetical protein
VGSSRNRRPVMKAQFAVDGAREGDPRRSRRRSTRSALTRWLPSRAAADAGRRRASAAMPSRSSPWALRGGQAVVLGTCRSGKNPPIRPPRSTRGLPPATPRTARSAAAPGRRRCAASGDP